MSLRIVFMGTPDFAIPTLDALVHSEHQVVGVFCQPDKQKGRGKQVQMPIVKEYALAHDIPVYQPNTLRNEGSEALLATLAPDVVVVVAYGKILPPWLIRMPKYGCINVHGSILPKYRGAAPIQYAVLKGDAETGITVMHMDDGLDTGDIIEIVKTPIGETETSGELFERLAALGGQSIVSILNRWVSGEITATPQGEGATHTTKITKEMGELDFTKSARDLCNQVRGLNPWPGGVTYLQEKRLKVWRATVVDGKVATPGTIVALGKDYIDVATGNGTLRLLEVQPDNKKRMNGGDYSRGHQLQIGMMFHENK